MWRLGRADRARRHDDPRARRARRGAAAAAGRHGTEPTSRRGAVDGRAALAVGAADVPARDAWADRRRSRSCASCSIYDRFPRSVRGCLDEIRRVLASCPTPTACSTPRRRRAVLRVRRPTPPTAHELDDAMDACRSRSPSSTRRSPTATCGSGRCRRRRSGKMVGAASGARRVAQRTPGCATAARRRPARRAPGAGRPAARRRRAPATSCTTCRCAPTAGWRRSRAGRGGSTRSRSCSTRDVPTGCRGRSPSGCGALEACSPTSTAPRTLVARRDRCRPRRWRRATATASPPSAPPPPPRWLTTYAVDVVARRRRVVARRPGPHRHAARASATRCSTAR